MSSYKLLVTIRTLLPEPFRLLQHWKNSCIFSVISIKRNVEKNLENTAMYTVISKLRYTNTIFLFITLVVPEISGLPGERINNLLYLSIVKSSSSGAVTDSNLGTVVPEVRPV